MTLVNIEDQLTHRWPTDLPSWKNFKR